MLKQGDVIEVDMQRYNEWLTQSSSSFVRSTDNSPLWEVSFDFDMNGGLVNIAATQITTRTHHYFPVRFVIRTISRSPEQGYFLSFD